MYWQDSSGRDIQLGVASVGLVVFQNKKKINTFSWAKIVKIAFKRKEFFIQLRRELVGYYCRGQIPLKRSSIPHPSSPNAYGR